MLHRLYVIEVSSDPEERVDPRIPFVYVGETTKRREDRLEIHQKGGRNAARIFKGRGARNALRLRPELYFHLDEYGEKSVAEGQEKRLARYLAGFGFVAYCGGRKPFRVEPEDVRTWKRWHLERAAEYLTRAVVATVRDAMVPPSTKVCAHLLGGNRQPWIERYVDLSDPFASHGLFPQCRLAHLQARGELVIN